jgi:hypothetical protein
MDGEDFSLQIGIDKVLSLNNDLNVGLVDSLVADSDNEWALISWQVRELAIPGTCGI